MQSSQKKNIGGYETPRKMFSTLASKETQSKQICNFILLQSEWQESRKQPAINAKEDVGERDTHSL